METASSSRDSRQVTEKLVARLWDDQRPLRLPLLTEAGEEIQVVYRGRRRWDRGPDFAGALIAWPGARLVHGDVEIHVRSGDWRAHGHHRDPHYNGVILEVVMWNDAAEPALRQDGARVPVVVLADRLAAPLEALLPLAESTPAPPIPCWTGPLDGRDGLAARLDRCGVERFEQKAARFEADLTCFSPDQLLYQGIATALGYSQNREPFARLAEVVPLDLLRAFGTGRRGDGERGTQDSGPRTQDSTPLAAEALLLGTAGLLPSQRGLGVEDPRERVLEELWALEGAARVARPLWAGEWAFFRVRPANFPTRRVAALARLVDRWLVDGPAEALVSLLDGVEPRRAPRALEGLLLGRDPGEYWSRHCDFGQRLRRPADLIGRQRAAEVAVNVFLPFLAGWAAHLGDDLLGARVREVYLAYPKRGDNEISRYAATQLTGIPRPRVARSACRQQGLLHLYRRWCETKRCGACPCGGGVP